MGEGVEEGGKFLVNYGMLVDYGINLGYIIKLSIHFVTY